jgi:hypothetical protein
MDDALAARATLVGRLTLLVPAIGAIPAVLYLGVPMFGPFYSLYYAIAGVAIGWQWYLVAFPHWEKWLSAKGAQPAEVDALARRSGLAWPLHTALGPFALHTAAAAACGINIGPWILSRWYVWILPLTGRANYVSTGNEYLQNFELATTIPALAIGYLLATRFRKFATYAWIVPTIVLVYKLLTFTDPHPSVFRSFSPMAALEYFFAIQRRMPTLTPGFGGVDPVRSVEQMTVMAPFYAGLAYSLGALAEKHDLLRRAFPHPSGEVETEVVETPQPGNPEESEKPIHEPS